MDYYCTGCYTTFKRRSELQNHDCWVERIRRDREFLDHSLRWPRWPVLPMKLRNGDATSPQFCGFVYGHVDVEPVIYFGNIFGFSKVVDKLKKELGKGNITYSELLTVFPYDSLDDLVQEYRVD